jgi:hypothetical protein
VATVGLTRCTDPYNKIQRRGRRYVKVKVTKSDLEAVDRCVLWALGIDPKRILLNQSPSQPETAPVALDTV